MPKEVYKVVRKWSLDSHLGSAYVPPQLGSHVKYSPGKWSSAPEGKLFAFKNAKYAYDFVSAGDLLVYKAQARGIENRAPDTIVDVLCITDQKIQQFWADLLDSLFAQDAPRGTILCDSIKLIEQV